MTDRFAKVMGELRQAAACEPLSLPLHCQVATRVLDGVAAEYASVTDPDVMSGVLLAVSMILSYMPHDARRVLMTHMLFTAGLIARSRMEEE